MWDTLLHAFITHVDPCMEKAEETQQKFEELLRSMNNDSDALYMRDRAGLTPLHLAIRLSLPHVVGVLLLRLSSRPNAVKEALSVESYDGTMLLQDVHDTYWAARDSPDEHVFHTEVDALIYLCLVTNAMAGKLPRKDHAYRALRVAQNWPKTGNRSTLKRRSSYLPKALPRFFTLFSSPGKRACDDDEDTERAATKKTAYSPRWTADDDIMDLEHEYIHFREASREYEKRMLGEMSHFMVPGLSPEAQIETGSCENLQTLFSDEMILSYIVG
jgi:hypothetical protein